MEYKGFFTKKKKLGRDVPYIHCFTCIGEGAFSDNFNHKSENVMVGNVN